MSEIMRITKHGETVLKKKTAPNAPPPQRRSRAGRGVQARNASRVLKSICAVAAADTVVAAAAAAADKTPTPPPLSRYLGK